MERFERLQRLANEYQQQGFPNGLRASDLERLQKYAEEKGIIAAIWFTWAAGFMTGKNYQKQKH